MTKTKIVYAIMHNKTRRIYIGSTERGSHGLKNHLNALRAGKHKNKLMQDDFDKYGEDYSFYQLDFIPTSYQSDRERYWMSFFDTYNPEKGYYVKYNTISSWIKIDDFPKIDMSEADPVPTSTIRCFEKVARFLGVSIDELLQ